tara:strand:- start:2312 stop:2620 length:309 start_codon:yes stop_codon:yes gene_type:complete
MSTFGPAYKAEIDGVRIGKQHEVIRDFMLHVGYRTLAEISKALDYPESSISAQLRHLRKEKFGSYVVSKRRRVSNQGTWEYSVASPDREPVQQELIYKEDKG